MDVLSMICEIRSKTAFYKKTGANCSAPAFRNMKLFRHRNAVSIA